MDGLSSGALGNPLVRATFRGAWRNPARAKLPLTRPRCVDVSAPPWRRIFGCVSMSVSSWAAPSWWASWRVWPRAATRPFRVRLDFDTHSRVFSPMDGFFCAFDGGSSISPESGRKWATRTRIAGASRSGPSSATRGPASAAPTARFPRLVLQRVLGLFGWPGDPHRDRDRHDPRGWPAAMGPTN